MTDFPLTASLNWSKDRLQSGDLEYDVIEVYLGDTHIATLPITAEPSRAGHGDDSTYFASEERRILTETLAPYLQHIFNPANINETT